MDSVETEMSEVTTIEDKLKETTIHERAQQQNEEYFQSYQDVEVHRLMVSDAARTDAYRDAIMKNRHLFQDKVVMDVGAGTGILSLFAAQAGAKRVYAVEASAMAYVTKKIVEDNGLSHVITVIHSRVEDIVELPQDSKVDVIISEWMGFYLLHESMLGSVLSARRRFLEDGGTMFPSHARILAAPCSLSELFKDKVDYWNDVYGFDMSVMKKIVLQTSLQDKPEICSLDKKELLTEPIYIKKFDLRWVEEDELKDFSVTHFVKLKKTGRIQGLCLWFECDFDGLDYNEDGDEMGCIVKLSTGPESKMTHWKQTVIVFGSGRLSKNEPRLTGADEPKVKRRKNSTSDDIADEIVEANEVVGWKINFAQSYENERHYSITLEMLDPETDEHPIPCLCSMPKCAIINAYIDKADELPDDVEIIDCT